ncbi:YchJ family protein [Paraglaciecola aquimarina]|uniref:YchJ family protein n=1 Tax=Paraglaciecola algarum TaxID=3050085 RepID=A0ABS9DBT3_9ALTE|nr:YchJ family protein [Paraglaciecola sp. G1-23]MCF2950384.1 YchJ family protein [Paraglaciecola sp. G1-23]
MTTCYCNSGLTFSQCCQPYLQKTRNAPTAESLMRSRFSAYVRKDFEYILKTYAEEQRSKLSISELEQSAEDTHWLSLQVVDHSSKENSAQVEFKAYYQISNQYYVMHELSDFVRVNDCWFYTTGTMQQDTGEIKPERNSTCLCASGKKFKKCCGK